MSGNAVPQGLPLREVESDFRAVAHGAVEQRHRIEDFVSACVARGIDSIVFVGTGGSFASSVHAVATLRSRLVRHYVDNVMSAEALTIPMARVGSRTLVVASSHSGGTPETVAATEMLKSKGATIISLSSQTDSPLGRLADMALGYNSDRTITSAKQILLAHITWALLDKLEEIQDSPERVAAYKALPSALLSAIDQQDEALARIADDIKDSPFIYVLAAGPNYGAAYLLSMCYLMEMQWKRSASFYAGEFFHGAFEMVEPEAAVITLIGEDSTRTTGERAHRFAARYSEHAHVIDSTDVELPGVPDEMRGEVTPILLGVLSSRLAEHMEAATGHSLDERRYMYKVEY